MLLLLWCCTYVHSRTSGVPVCPLCFVASPRQPRLHRDAGEPPSSTRVHVLMAGQTTTGVSRLVAGTGAAAVLRRLKRQEVEASFQDDAMSCVFSVGNHHGHHPFIYSSLCWLFHVSIFFVWPGLVSSVTAIYQ